MILAWLGSNDLDKFVSFVGSFCCIPLCYVYVFDVPPLIADETKSSLPPSRLSRQTATLPCSIFDPDPTSLAQPRFSTTVSSFSESSLLCTPLTRPSRSCSSSQTCSSEAGDSRFEWICVGSLGGIALDYLLCRFVSDHMAARFSIPTLCFGRAVYHRVPLRLARLLERRIR